MIRKRPGLTVFAAGALTAFLPSAHAQNSVTLYGIIDAGVSYTNNVKGASAWQETVGKLGGSRWGLRGSEDLGSGLAAIFMLESGFNAANGSLQQGGRLFGRQAFVGLSQANVGTLTFGRQYDPLADMVAPSVGSYIWAPSTHIGDSDNLTQTFRVNNSVKFRSASFGGLSADGLYGFSNQAGSQPGDGFANNRAWSAALNYTGGPVTFGAGYFELNHPNSSTNGSGAVGGATTTSGDDYSGAFFYNIDGGVARQRIGTASASVKLGLATLASSFSRVILDYNDGAGRKLDNYDVSLRYLIKPSLLLISDYVYTDGHATDLPGQAGKSSKPKWHQLTLGADYFLSTRTELYVTAEYQLAAGDASTLVNGHYVKIASIYTVGAPSSTNRQVSVSTGLRHKF
ncbi:porin [Burkholderia sp. PAMC 26561]|uniref:porin n=1 Tax=Burkholderia sp. PAMC 26561 TaxID=1795043 RepID=UPI00076B3348|nr:porin [Burkholderia sp. PAMC 26561]AME26949.1 porin [Burkholderia sp. PAMC 26561]AME27905.1 porin [Burkholderia sp. PAMC 26561]